MNELRASIASQEEQVRRRRGDNHTVQCVKLHHCWSFMQCQSILNGITFHNNIFPIPMNMKIATAKSMWQQSTDFPRIGLCHQWNRTCETTISQE